MCIAVISLPRWVYFDMCIDIKNFFSAFTMFIAITFPFFDGLLGFFGGFAFAPTTYFVSHDYLKILI